MQKLRVTALLMGVAIIGVTGFQSWWLKNNYDNEKQSLELRVSTAFRATVLKLQAAKLHITDLQLSIDSGAQTTMVVRADKKGGMNVKTTRVARTNPSISLVNLLQEKISAHKNDSAAVVIIERSGDSVFRYQRNNLKDRMPDSGKKVEINFSSTEDITNINDEKAGLPKDILIKRVHPAEPAGKNKGLIRFLYNMDSLAVKDSIRLSELDSAFNSTLKEEKINVSARLFRLDSTDKPTATEVNIGFSKPLRYDYSLGGTASYIFRRLKLPILFSLLLVGITIASFVLLYRNLMKQKRLAEVKNEFISNITHELKTPIATVGVAIEALKDFSAINDPARTREYLDISQQELQRLNLLVDKVLKLSMFENKKMEMNFSPVDLKGIAEEVIHSMRLQLEKHHAVALLRTEGNTTINGDRLHLVSVIYNLLDNALKYGKPEPVINIKITEKDAAIELYFADNGIGIPSAYQEKVFEKFFRVPHGNTHNARGYGLGLSYVSQVVKDHGGSIRLNSEEGKGTEFNIELPKQKA